ncbi:MAG TPA: hypothetical protein VL995_00415 [Cellvibrio sp.]|nr:hypothetical protein [Cellvibrio sp.]
MESKTKENNQDNNVEKSEMSSFWKFFAVIAPAYTYFFGYTSKKYYLEALGFSNPSISSEPGSVYESAMNSFFYLTGISYENAWPIFWGGLKESWTYILIAALLAGGIFYFFFDFFFTDKAKEKQKQKNRADRAKITFKITAFSVLANILSFPILFVFMALICMVLYPAPIIGRAMASSELIEFYEQKCMTTEKYKSIIMPCTTLIIEDGQRIGVVKHQDEDFIYLLTEEGPYAVPKDTIKSQQRHFAPDASSKIDALKN